jgi:8-oxo-dGTP diphosphatase
VSNRLSANAFCYPYARPAVTVDITLFTFLRDHLQVLLIQRQGEPFRGCWALPGGFVDENEDLQHAAARELQEETGVSDVYLEQLYTFGEPGRDPRGHVISVAYLALLSADRARTLCVEGRDDAAAARWWNIYDLPALAFDHDQVLVYALQRVRWKLEWTALGFLLLPAEFTLTELQLVYERALGETLDKRNFRRKMLASSVEGERIIEETGGLREGDHRPAKLYRFSAKAIELEQARRRFP